MRRVGAGTSSGKIRLLQPVAPLMHAVEDDPDGASSVAAWRGHLPEIALVSAVWVLALVQVGIVIVRGGAWTPDSTLAIAFALACPLALRGFRRA